MDTMVKLATRPVIDELQTLRRGLHISMDHLINRRDFPEAERVLREVDVLLDRLIRDTKLAE